MSKVELKNCPFCGGKAELVRIKNYGMADECWVGCAVCECRTHIDYDKEDDVIKIWNTRKPM